MKIDSKTVGNFCGLLSGAGKIVIIGHHNPDGDCIGCITGMECWIESAFSKAGTMIVPDIFPDYLKFMCGTDSILVYSRQKSQAEEAISGADLIICMDFSALSRTEGMADLIRESGAKKVLIDHHPSPEQFADIVFSETEVSSAAELTWWILKAAEEEFGSPIPFQAKTSLYTGMMTDTNNFCNSVFPSTFLMASQIAEAGIDREKIQMEIMNSFSEERMRLMGLMLKERMTVYPDLKAAVMVLDQATKDLYNYRDGDSEGFVNLPLKIKNVEISALLTQANGYIKVSLRSKGAVSVNRLCRQFFNGGGHERAAGGRIYDVSVEEVADYFEKSLRRFLGEFPA